MVTLEVSLVIRMGIQMMILSFVRLRTLPVTRFWKDSSEIEQKLFFYSKSCIITNFFVKSSLNSSNNIPSFSLGQYYDYANQVYTQNETNSKEFDHCDCLRTNPLLVVNDTCKMSLDQDTFNGNTVSSPSLKRSIIIETHEKTNDWKHSFSLVKNK